MSGQTIADIESALAGNPDDARLWGARAFLYLEEGDYDEAVESADRATKLDEHDSAAWLVHSTVLLRQGHQKEASESARRAVELDDESWVGWSQLGSTLAGLDDERALEAFTRAIQLGPGNGYDVLNRAGTYARLGRMRESLEGFRQGVRLLPDYAGGWISYGSCALAMAERQEAIDAFDRARALDPNEVFALAGKAIALSDLGYHRDALALWGEPARAIGLTLINDPDRSEISWFERTIPAMEASLSEVPADRMPGPWRTAQRILAGAYANRALGDRSENIERSLEHFELAADEELKRTDPTSWSRVQREIARVYRLRSQGNAGDNVREALARYDAASEAYPRKEHPDEWRDMNLELADYGRELVEAMDAQSGGRLGVIAEDDSFLGAQTRRGTFFRESGTAYDDPAVFEQRIIRYDGEQAALRGYTAALQAVDRKHQPEAWAHIQVQLGHAYLMSSLGDTGEAVEEAIACFRKALDIIPAAEKTSLWEAAKFFEGKAHAMRVFGTKADNIECAIACYREVAEARRSESPETQAENWYELANVLAARERGDPAENLEEAVCCWERALAGWADGSESLRRGMSLHLIGSARTLLHALGRAGQLDAASAALAAALELFQANEEAVRRARTQLALAVVSQTRDSYGRSGSEEAIPYYLAALEVLSPEELPVQGGPIAAELADCYARLERWSEAAEQFSRSVGAAEVTYSLSGERTAKDRSLMAGAGTYARAAFAYAKIGRLDSAAASLERGLGRGLGEVLLRERADLGRLEQEAPELHSRYIEAIHWLRTREARTRAAALAGHEELRAAADAIDFDALGTAYGEVFKESVTRSNLEEITDEIRALPGFGDFAVERPRDALRSACANATLAYLACTPWGSMSLVARGTAGESSLSVHFGDLVDDEVLELVGGDRARLLERTGEALMGPLAEDLREHGDSLVVLLPSGALAAAPLHAAPYAGTATCLIDEVDVAFSPSASAYSHAADAASRTTGLPPRLAAIGNPLPARTPLPFAEAEVESLRALFPGEPGVAVRERATSGRLVELLNDANYVHLACHGVYDGGDPFASHLSLAGGEQLNLADIVQLGMFEHVRLAFASACESAASDTARLPDEAVGFPGAFLQGGASGVIGTLWAVADLATALLVLRCYELHLQSEAGELAPAAALRRAQIWLRELTGRELVEFTERYSALRFAAGREIALARRYPGMRPFADPEHWAGFVAVGV